MKTKEEVIADFWEEDRKYKELIQGYMGNQQALAEADWMYQEGVRVDEIKRTLEESWSGTDEDVEQGSN